MLHTSNTPSILQIPVIIMGADVTHPASDFKNSKPSIAAIVGSMDAKVSQYLCEIRLQVKLCVFLEHFLSTFSLEHWAGGGNDFKHGRSYKKLLIQFKNKNLGRKPEKIIFYRFYTSLIWLKNYINI